MIPSGLAMRRSLILLSFSTLALHASAQPEASAEALFDRGLRDMQSGNYDKGCPALAESHRLDPRLGTLFTLAECEAQWGKTGSAVAHYRDQPRCPRARSDPGARQALRSSRARSRRHRACP
jgi:hypothetical protein